MPAPTGNIYAQSLLHSTKKVSDLRQANKEVYSGVGRAVYGEVALTNYGAHIVDNCQKQKKYKEANKEVFTPDLSRTLMENKPSHGEYTKAFNESQKEFSEKQAPNKGAHTGDLYRTVFERGNDTQVYAKALNQKTRDFNEKQAANKGAHTSDIYRTVFERETDTQTYAKALNENLSQESIRQAANKGAHLKGNMLLNIYYGNPQGATPEKGKASSKTTTTTQVVKKTTYSGGITSDSILGPLPFKV